MAKSTGGKGGGSRQGGKSKGANRPGGGWPSKTGNPSGGRRTNNPPGRGRKR